MDKTTKGSLTFSELLQFGLIMLKLAHIINWPWWQVFLPAICGAAIFVVVMIGFIVGWIIKSR